MGLDAADWSLDQQRLYARIEDAGLNASATPQQLWMDGWLLRFSPGKAKRARCINGLAPGRMALDARLAWANNFYKRQGLPIILRITPFTQPEGLDDALAQWGYDTLDDTRVMASTALAAAAATAPLPPGYALRAVGVHAFAQAVGSLRGSTVLQQQAHAQRLELSPLNWRAFVVRREADGHVVAAGQAATEGELVGLYDINTDLGSRNLGLATHVCQHALTCAAQQDGARVAYLQVEADNDTARRIYHRLGFADVYRYHYRVQPLQRVECSPAAI